jgi:hypothetical protein
MRAEQTRAQDQEQNSRKNGEARHGIFEHLIRPKSGIGSSFGSLALRPCRRKR